MKYFLILLIFLPVLSFAQDLDCTRFKTGKYVLKDEARQMESLIIRNDTIQMEFMDGPDPKAKFKVTWVSECKYDLDILDGPEDMVSFYGKMTLHIEIVETYESSYKFKAAFDGYPELTDIMHKIE